MAWIRRFDGGILAVGGPLLVGREVGSGILHARLTTNGPLLRLVGVGQRSRR